MLSGIGPAAQLRGVGIEPLVDLPGVGRNLGEHPQIQMSWQAAQANTLVRHFRWDRVALGALR